MSTLSNQRKTELQKELLKLETVLEPITYATEFFQVYDQLVATKSGFAHNREQILDAWQRGLGRDEPLLYQLRVVETQDLFDNRELCQDLAEWMGCHPSHLVIPSLLWRDYGNVCIMLWVAPEFQRLGFGTRMVREADIERVSKPLPQAASFWQKLQISETDWLPPPDWVATLARRK